MAALPYMQLYIADYLADTMHLSTEEHGAYLLLMFNYWQTGKAIPKNRLAKIARMSNERWNSVEESLKEFFIDNGTEWMHQRIEEDLESVYSSLEQKSAAGKASAAKRKARKEQEKERDLNGNSTTVEDSLEREGNGNSTNKDKDKDKELKDPHKSPTGNAGRNKFDPLNVELPDWLPRGLWAEWVEYRKQLKQPIKTLQGVTGTINKISDFMKSGYSAEEIIREAMANEWRGIYEPKKSRLPRQAGNEPSGKYSGIPPGFRG